MVVRVLVFLLLITTCAVFSGSDVAYMSLDASLFDDSRIKDQKILALKANPNRLLGTTQIGAALCAVLIGIYASSAFLSSFDAFLNMQFHMNAWMTYVSAVLFLVFVVLPLVLTFGVLVPRRMAMAFPVRFVKSTFGILSFFMVLGTPLYVVVSWFANLVLRLFGIDPSQVSRVVSEADIRSMVQSSAVDVQEKMMIDNVFEFDNLEVQEIMVHRTDVVAIDKASSFEDISALMIEARYTRFPVFEDNIDNVVGIIHLRDVYRFMADAQRLHFDVVDLMRDPYFVPDTKTTDEVFADMKRLKIHMAIVIDEYGGTAGIVTMEDLIEEVMGNIMDEYDDEEEAQRDVILQADGTYLVEGSCDLEELQNVLDIELPIDDFDTVSGYMIDVLGKIPTADDMADDAHRFVVDGYEFSINAVEEKVIARVLVKKMA